MTEFLPDKLVKEWSWRTDTGIPDYRNPLHLVELKNLLIERRFPHQFHTQSPSIEVINSYDGESQQKGMFDSEGYLEYFKILDYYEKGHTIIMSNVFDLTEELRLLEGAISDSFAFYPVYGNFYMSKDGRGGFKSHDHPLYDVYVKQIYGTSHWV